MAAGQHTRTRREVLGGALGVPLACHAELVSASSFPPRERATSWTLKQVQGDEEKWREILAAYRAAEAEVRGFERATAGSSFEEVARFEAGYGELGDAMYDALRRLLAAPAPDVAALAVKLDLVVEHEVGTLEGGEACFEAIRGDAWRLSRM